MALELFKPFVMRDLVKKMDESEIRNLAKEISDFNAQFRSKQ